MWEQVVGMFDEPFHMLIACRLVPIFSFNLAYCFNMLFFMRIIAVNEVGKIDLLLFNMQLEIGSAKKVLWISGL